MSDYLSIRKADKEIMLEKIGLSDEKQLYKDIPEELLLNRELDLPSGISEMQVLRTMKNLAAKNKVYETVFRGAGAYRHYIPAVVDQVVSKETFLTAYTPYQAEISQGILQCIFEYQTMICELTGLEVSNASVYDGATAAAEAAAMCRDKKRHKVLISAAVDPEVAQVMRTYSWAANAEIEEVPVKDGITDLDALKEMTDETVAAVYIQHPNYFGCLEKAAEAAEIAHAKKAKLIMGVNPIACAILKTPKEYGADIAVGEGQPLGMPLSYGGPYLGFMAASKDMMRKLPGRIVGQTTDDQGRTAYVLTLQAREQHIRREKASSNICSNEALCAMRAAVYMSAMGKEGIREAARQCVSKAHYMKAELEKAGFACIYNNEFFHEFVTECPCGSKKAAAVLSEHGILAGLPLSDHEILWCVTEVNTKEEIDRAVSILREVRA